MMESTLNRAPHRSWRTIGCLIVFLSTGPIGWGQSVVLTLKNGDRLTGTVSSENAKRILLETPWAKEIAVPMEEIVRRETLPPPRTNAVGVVVQAPAIGQPAKPVVAKPPKRWIADAQVGVDLGFNRVDRQTYSGKFRLTYSHEHLHNLFDCSFAYGRIQTATNNVPSANRMDGSDKIDFDLSPRVYVYNLAGAGFDRIRDIVVRYEAGPGVGYYLVKGKTFIWKGEYGVNYQAQYFDTHNVPGARENIQSVYYRLAEEAVWKIGTRWSLDEKFEFFPKATRFSEYRFRVESNLRYWISTSLSLSVSLLDIYDTQHAPDSNPNDLQLRSSIGWKF